MTENKEKNFVDLNLPQQLIKNLANMDVHAPKPIQAKVIEPMLEGNDVLAVAQTGSGKTFAFSLPILAKLIGMGAKRRPKAATALILTPTRELAVQIEQAVRKASKNMHLRVGLVLGGVSRFQQIKQMAPGVDMLIATPGRLMDHVREGNIDLSQTSYFVLDEADRMLDMGFIRDVRAIASRLAKPRQTALFSATMPKEVAGLAESLLNNPLKIETSPQGSVVADIKETIYPVSQREKKNVLVRLLAQEDFKSVIVFTRTKHGADSVEKFLKKAGCPVAVIHGNKSQNARQRALDLFRRGKIRVLLATDIAARGIDVPGVSHVINFEFPVEAESYVHRIGRTGRNGASGEAITLYDSSLEASRFRAIGKLTKKKLMVSDLPTLPVASFPKYEIEESENHNTKPRKIKADKNGKLHKKRKFRSEKNASKTRFSNSDSNESPVKKRNKSFARTTDSTDRDFSDKPRRNSKGKFSNKKHETGERERGKRWNTGLKNKKPRREHVVQNGDKQDT